MPTSPEFLNQRANWGIDFGRSPKSEDYDITNLRGSDSDVDDHDPG